MALLTIAQQQAIKALDYNWSMTTVGGVTGGVTNFEQLEKETEESLLADLLGVALLQDIQENPTSAANIVLLDGGTYTDCNNNTIKFKGLRYVLAYLIWSSHVSNSFAKDTAIGLVKKRAEESESLNIGERKELAAYNSSLGAREFEKIKAFLNENSSTYPLWVCSDSKSIALPKFSSVRKTIYK